MQTPPLAFLADVYRHLPFIVIHITTDGIVLHCNPETCLATGYEEKELLGKNLWGILFPGKLFAQVPKFISLASPSPLLKDMPMTIRTRQGSERVIAFSRFVHANAGGDADFHADAGPRTFICVGVDLTDRLLNADRAQLSIHDFASPPAAPADPHADPANSAFGPQFGNAGAIDSEIVTPIAITPRALRPVGSTDAPCPIEQVREGMARVETHMNCVASALDAGEAQVLAALRETLRRHLAHKPGFNLFTRGEWLHPELAGKAMGCIRARVDELLALHRPQFG